MLEGKLGLGPRFLPPFNFPHPELLISGEMTVLCGWYPLTRTSLALTNVFFEDLGFFAGEVDPCRKVKREGKTACASLSCVRDPFPHFK